MGKVADLFALLVQYASKYEEVFAWIGTFLLGFAIGAWVF